jgi:hypothetical protein
VIASQPPDFDAVENECASELAGRHQSLPAPAPSPELENDPGFFCGVCFIENMGSKSSVSSHLAEIPLEQSSSY